MSSLRFDEEDVDEFQAWEEDDDEQLPAEADASLDGMNEQNQEPLKQMEARIDLIDEQPNERHEGPDLNEDYDLNESIKSEPEEYEEETLSSIAAKLQRIDLYLPDLSLSDTLREQLKERHQASQPESYKELSEMQTKCDELTKELELLHSLWFISQLVNEIRVNLDLYEFKSVFHSLDKLNSKVSGFQGYQKGGLLKSELLSKYDELYDESLKKLNEVMSKSTTSENDSFELIKVIHMDEHIELNLNDLYDEIIEKYSLNGKISVDLTKIISRQVIDKLITDQYLITAESEMKLSITPVRESHRSIEDKIQSLKASLTLIMKSPTHQNIIQYTQASINKYILANIIKPYANNIFQSKSLKEHLLQMDDFLINECHLRSHAGEGIKAWCQDDKLSVMIEESQYEQLFQEVRDTILNFNALDVLIEREVIIRTLTQQEKSSKIQTVQEEESWNENWESEDEMEPVALKLKSSSSKLGKAPVVTMSQPLSSKETKRQSVIKADDDNEEWDAWGEEEEELDVSPEQSAIKSPVSIKNSSPPRSKKSPKTKRSTKRLSTVINEGGIEEGEEEWDAWGPEEEPIEFDSQEPSPKNKQAEDIFDERESYKSSALPDSIYQSLTSKQHLSTGQLSKLVLTIKLLLQIKGLTKWRLHNELRYLSTLASNCSNQVLSDYLQQQCQDIVDIEVSSLQLTIQKVIMGDLRSFDPDIIKDHELVTKSLSVIPSQFNQLMDNSSSMLTSSESLRLIDNLISQWYEYLIRLILTTREEIGDAESNNLFHTFEQIYNESFINTPKSLSANQSSLAYQSRNRLVNITRVLTSHLSEIMDWFYEGELFDITTEELLQLMKLLFVESETRTRCEGEVREIREGTL